MGAVREILRRDTGRWYWAAAAFALAALLPEYLMPVLCAAAYIAVLRGRVPLAWTEKIACVLFGWLLIGTVYSGARISSVGTLFLWGFFLPGCRMMLHSVDRASRLEAVFFCGSLGAGAAGGIGIAEMVLFHYGAYIAKPLRTMFNPFWHLLDTRAADLAVRLWPSALRSVLQRTQFIAIRDRASSTFTNPIFFAAFLCMMLPLCAWGVFFLRSRKKRIVSLLCLALDLGGIACSYSRGPYLAVSAAFVVLLFYGRRYAWRLLCAGGAAVLAAFLAMRGVFKRLLTLFHTEDISVSTHSEVWRACLKMLRGHWLFGYGTGVDNVRRMLHETYHIRQPHAHNVVLEILLENGVVGAGLFLAILAVFTLRLLRVARRGEIERGAAVTLLASMAAFCVCGMADYLFYGLKIICYFCMLLGLGECTARIFAPSLPRGNESFSDAAHETVSAGETL